SVSSDSIMMQHWVFHRTAGQVHGFADSLRWTAGSGLGSSVRVDGSGEWYERGDSLLLGVDTLSAALPAHRYRLSTPTSVAFHDSTETIRSLALQATDGSGVLRVSGTVPAQRPGALAIEIVGLDLHDLYGILQRDTLGVGGEVGLDLQVGGTATAPTLRGSAKLADARFGDFQAPFIQAVVNYEGHRLDANLDLWRTGEDILQVEAHLPMDLALSGVEKRLLDGALSVRAHTDSVDLGLLEALTPAVTRVDGTLAADVKIAGTWKTPRLAGSLAVRNG